MKKMGKMDKVCGFIVGPIAFIVLILLMTTPVASAPMSTAEELNAQMDQIDAQQNEKAADAFRLAYKNPRSLAEQISFKGGKILKKAHNGRFTEEWVPFEVQNRVHFHSPQKTWLYHLNKRLPF